MLFNTTKNVEVTETDQMHEGHLMKVAIEKSTEKVIWWTVLLLADVL